VPNPYSNPPKPSAQNPEHQTLKLAREEEEEQGKRRRRRRKPCG